MQIFIRWLMNVPELFNIYHHLQELNCAVWQWAYHRLIHLTSPAADACWCIANAHSSRDVVVVCFSSCRFVLMIVHPTVVWTGYFSTGQCNIIVGWIGWKLTHVVCGYISTLRFALYCFTMKLKSLTFPSTWTWNKQNTLFFSRSFHFHILLDDIGDSTRRGCKLQNEFKFSGKISHHHDTHGRRKQGERQNSLHPTTSSAWHQFILQQIFQYNFNRLSRTLGDEMWHSRIFIREMDVEWTGERREEKHFQFPIEICFHKHRVMLWASRSECNWM